MPESSTGSEVLGAADVGCDELGFEGEPFAPPGVLADAGAGPGTGAPVPSAALVAGETPAVVLPGATLARDIAEQVRQAHNAVLAAHGDIERWLLMRGRSSTRPSPAATPVLIPSSGPHTVELEYEIPADPEYGCPTASVLAGAGAALRQLGERALAPAGSVHHPGRATLVWSGELPEGQGKLRVRAGVHAVERDERGTRCAFEWQAYAGDLLVAEATGSTGFLLPADATEPLGGQIPWPEREVPRHPRQFRPLADTHRYRLTAQDILGLAGGYISTVFGPAFTHQASTLTLSRQAARLLLAVEEIAPEGGCFAQGRLVTSVSLRDHDSRRQHDGRRAADPAALLYEAAFGALQIYVLQRGLHLCMPDSRFQPWDGCASQIEILDPTALDGTLRYEIDVAELALVPRPHAVADVRVLAAGRLVARLHGVGVAVREKPGEDMTPLSAFEASVPPCRHNAAGEPAPMNELHVAYSAEGDLAVLGAGSHTLHTVRPRLPRGDFLMVNRGLSTDARPGEYRRGTFLVSEYDVHPDPWFCRENGIDAVPNLVYLESSLQSVTAISATQGIVSEYPDSPFVCRNLEGRATILRDADPRGRTLRQHTTLIDHSPLPGAILHRYRYEVALDGEPVYAGESVHGFFTPEVLARQQGLDGGRCVPNWLERQAPRPAGVRRLDLSGDTRLGRGRLALLHEIDLLPSGGEYGAGYALWERAVPDDDWFMAHHFFNDPVMPGSVGVEALFQAVGAWALHTGVADGLPEPRLRPAAGVELSWKYRGQILREHQRMCGEVHIREVRRSADRIVVIANGSVYRDDLRIYQVDTIGVEVRPAEGERP